MQSSGIENSATKHAYYRRWSSRRIMLLMRTGSSVHGVVVLKTVGKHALQMRFWLHKVKNNRLSTGVCIRIPRHNFTYAHVYKEWLSSTT
eukprot:1160331-Pelagomonas_calceolata.AAC.4